MFQSFSGSSRRPRQVNLSGRGGTGPVSPAHPAAARNLGPQNTLATAQQERRLRQQERDRLLAARSIQRHWRGYRCRRDVKAHWRELWDHHEQSLGIRRGHTTDSTDLSREAHMIRDPDTGLAYELKLLLQFFDPTSEGDRRRLLRFTNRFLDLQGKNAVNFGTEPWRIPLLRLMRLSIRNPQPARMASTPTTTEDSVDVVLSLLICLAKIVPTGVAQSSTAYYRYLRQSILSDNATGRASEADRGLLLEALLIPLRSQAPKQPHTYKAFFKEFLTIPDLNHRLEHLETLADNLDSEMMFKTMASIIREGSDRHLGDAGDSEGQLWLLAYTIYLHERRRELSTIRHDLRQSDYVTVLLSLLGSVAHELDARLQVDDVRMNDIQVTGGRDRTGVEPSRSRPSATPLPTFIRSQIMSLINQKSITGLLSHLDGEAITVSDTNEMAEARLIAGYALTLLHIFPRRSDELRMWLYLGISSGSSASRTGPDRRLPAVKYFWDASRQTSLFTAISRDSRAVLDLIRPRGLASGEKDVEVIRADWRVILLFFELYTFVLKVMDDDEFFSRGSNQRLSVAEHATSSWTRESALSLVEVKDLTIFLKNVAFTLYWNAAELSEMREGVAEKSFRDDGNQLHERSERDTSTTSVIASRNMAGMTGMTLEYIKGVVTGLLRMIYERDSRRRFLPKDHWLMTEHFDMQGFIPDVVMEEENRHRVQEAGEDDDEDAEGGESEAMDVDINPNRGVIIGTRHAQHTRAFELLERRQRQASRRKYLELVTPRLEILQNMPFFIPFETRVQIFRSFVVLDQRRRRNGHIDPDQWRMSLMQDPLLPSDREAWSKHHAKIRRESVFEDAYEQFYELGEGLKEPIQITFVDKFDALEAGIDGGGVTKEFLTSVTSEAFSASSGLQLFIENDQHLLHPNPSAVEERKAFLRGAGLREGSSEWNVQIRDLLRRYEFLGRVIGKCMYEGILVDVEFAGFFLLKWALTGGSGSATKESGYRANLNDLRDLDEGLYQGLLQLKNHPGNVEDFSLNFTVTDTISTRRDNGDEISSQTMTRDLRPNGAQIPVTNENRLAYISYIARHRLQVQPHLQTSAFLRGLSTIIQPSWLSMFNRSELQTLVGGDSSEIDVQDLRRQTIYGGVYTIGDDGQEHPSVQLFWEVMNSLGDGDRRKVLKFVTSTPRAPLLGFAQLHPRFSIRDAGPDESRLPSTSTCVNLLKLPRFSAKETLKEKLLYAINAGAGFDLS